MPVDYYQYVCEILPVQNLVETLKQLPRKLYFGLKSIWRGGYISYWNNGRWISVLNKI